jgi:hypothetical protein
MNATKTRLGDFGADQLFVVSTGKPSGYSVDLTDTEGTALDDHQVEVALTSPWDLEGTVEDGVWTWDGNGSPRDYNGNTITAIRAYMPQESD